MPNLGHPPALRCTDRDLPSIGNSTLKRMYGESNGSDKAVEEEDELLLEDAPAPENSALALEDVLYPFLA